MKTTITVYGLATVLSGKEIPFTIQSFEQRFIGGFLGTVFFDKQHAYGFNGYEVYKYDRKKFERALTKLKDHQPKYIRCYDNGGNSFDRYTVVYTGNYSGKPYGIQEYVGMSESPFNPLGFGQHGEGLNIDTPTYGHLGKKIKFTDLPPDCQTCVLQDYIKNWNY